MKFSVLVSRAPGGTGLAQLPPPRLFREAWTILKIESGFRLQILEDRKGNLVWNGTADAFADEEWSFPWVCDSSKLSKTYKKNNKMVGHRRTFVKK